MAIGDPYATVEELRSSLKVETGDPVSDEDLIRALVSVSRAIESWCERQFNDSGTPSPRRYRPLNCGLVLVDDFSTSDGLIVETSTDGSTWQTWDAADYELEPTDGIVDGRPGWPYCRIRAVGARQFPVTRRTSVRVTARWGWAEVPAPVKEACLLLAAESVKLPDAPFGVAGFGEYGPVRVRDNPIAQNKLAPYRRAAARVL